MESDQFQRGLVVGRLLQGIELLNRTVDIKNYEAKVKAEQAQKLLIEAATILTDDACKINESI
jgi:hypothetical protein